MSTEKRNLLIVAAIAGFLVTGIWYGFASAALDVPAQSSGPDVREPLSPPPSDPSLSNPPSPSAKSDITDPNFWAHARDPFAIPNATQLCAKGVVQACAIQTPSD